jgi:transposase
MSKKRKNHTAQEKTAILREHLINRVPVSDLCDRHGIHPTQFYRWQKTMFEGLPQLFESRRGSEVSSLRRQNESLKEKLAHKDTVIAQITEDYVAVKKSLGED